MDGCEVCYNCNFPERDREELERLRDPTILEGQYNRIGCQGSDVRPHSIVNADLRRDL